MSDIWPSSRRLRTRRPHFREQTRFWLWPRLVARDLLSPPPSLPFPATRASFLPSSFTLGSPCAPSSVTFQTRLRLNFSAPSNGTSSTSARVVFPGSATDITPSTPFLL